MKNTIYAVHCWIKGWWALNVLESFIIKKVKNWQSVDMIFTLYSDRDELVIQNDVIARNEAIQWLIKDNWKSYNTSTMDCFASSQWQTIRIPIITALPQRLNNLFRWVDNKKPPLISYFLDYRNLMPFFPWLMRRLSKKLALKLQQQDADILISSYAVAKNIDVPVWIFKEIYFHQPMHYIWPLYEEYVGYMKWWKQWLYKKITPSLRRWDSKPREYDLIYANSESTKKQIQEIYFKNKTVLDRDIQSLTMVDSSQAPVVSSSKKQNDVNQSKIDIQVVHPPIDKAFFYEPVVTVPDNYFFYINRLTKMFKHLDKIIHLCNEYHIPLIIAGDGPDKLELMKIAGQTITFVWWVSDQQTKISLMKKSRWVLNIAHESFGIVTAEALLLWVPIFGYRWWATPELVDKKSWLLVDSLEKEELSGKFEQFLATDFDRQSIQDNARKKFIPAQQFWN